MSSKRPLEASLSLESMSSKRPLETEASLPEASELSQLTGKLSGKRPRENDASVSDAPELSRLTGKLSGKRPRENDASVSDAPELSRLTGKLSGKRPRENDASVSDAPEISRLTGNLSAKRPVENETSESIGQERSQLTRMLPVPINGIREAMAFRQLVMMVSVSPTLVESFLRGMIHNVVNDAIPNTICGPPGSIVRQIQPSTQNIYELRFNCKLLNTFYTGDRIKGEGNEPVQLVIINCDTKEIVKSGHLSCAWTKILVLDGGFDKDERGSWTRKKFDSSVIRSREGKGPLLKGVVRKQLKDGVGLFNDISINDISHCTTNGKFKLGASVEHSKYPEETIREAASKHFTVKDRRLKASEKPDFLDLTDGVERLKNIGAKFLGKLLAADIKTVKDFLSLLGSDPKKLREVLGSRMSNNKWEETVAHALRCDTLFSKNLVQESRQLSSELPESIVEHFDSLHDGPPLPHLQDSSVPTSALGQQNHKSAARLNFQHPTNENCYMLGSSQVDSSMHNAHPIQDNLVVKRHGKLGEQLNVPCLDNHGELMPGTSQFNNVSVMGGSLQSQILNPCQEYLSGTDHFHRRHGDYGHEFPTGACVWSYEVGEPSHKYANDQMEQDGEADPLSSSLNAVGGTKRRWLKVRAVLSLTVRKPIPKRNSRWLKVRTSLNLTTARQIVAS